jgi:hypothetical protein
MNQSGTTEKFLEHYRNRDFSRGHRRQRHSAIGGYGVFNDFNVSHGMKNAVIVGAILRVRASRQAGPDRAVAPRTVLQTPDDSRLVLAACCFWNAVTGQPQLSADFDCAMSDLPKLPCSRRLQTTGMSKGP